MDSYLSSTDQSIEILTEKVKTLVEHYQQGKTLVQQLKEENRSLKEALQQLSQPIDETQFTIEKNINPKTILSNNPGEQLHIFSEVQDYSKSDLQNSPMTNKKTIMQYIQIIDAYIERLENNELNYD